MQNSIWVVNPNYSRDTATLIESARSGHIKANAQLRMAAYDRLPKAVRAAVGEYGQLKAAVKGGRSAASKVAAVRNAYLRKLKRTATCI